VRSLRGPVAQARYRPLNGYERSALPVGAGGNQVKVLFSDGLAWPSGNATRGANLPQLGHTVRAGAAERLAAGDSIERPHCGHVTGMVQLRTGVC
jgi:hypothetical protein